MKVTMTGPSLRIILATSAAVFAVGCGKKNKSPAPTAVPVAVAPVQQAPAAPQGPTTRAAPAPVAVNPGVGVAPQQAKLQVIISNKADAEVAVTPSALTLTFDIAGRTSSDPLSAYSFQCKLDSDSAFKDCTGATYFTFLGMTNSSQYTLTVQATVKATGMVIGSDSVSFTAAGLPAPTDIPATSGTPAPSAPPVLATGGAPSAGPVVVAPVVVAPVIPLSFLMGSRLLFTVPTDSHVTEYVSTLNYKSSLVAYRIAAQDDQAYIGNSSCIRDHDRNVKSSDSAKNVYNYCQTTFLNDGIYDGMPFYSPNHIEIGSNADVVLAGKETHVSINVYDFHQGFLKSRSQFWNLCQNKPIMVTPRIPVMKNFFGWATIESQIAVCRANLAPAYTLGQIADGTFNQNEFFVASFIAEIDETTNAIISRPCHVGGYEACESQVFLGTGGYRALVEVTVVGKVGTSGKNENDFAREQMALSLNSFSILH